MPAMRGGLTDERNTLLFLRRWSVVDEAAAANLMFGASGRNRVDSVEVHWANGYLHEQLLNPQVKDRTTV
jgi:hypothetical protein